MNIFFGILIGLLVLMFLIVAHEFGHFLLARRNGVTVKEFGIGFPPRAVAWKRVDGKWKKIPKSEWKNANDTLKAVGNDSKSKASKTPEPLILSLNWLPIGGFCQMDGESASDTRKGTFGAASYWSKTKILFGGVLMNWLVAFLILTVLAWTGMPTFLDGQFTVASDETTKVVEYVTVEDVLEDSPAATAGFRKGDKILRVGNTDVLTASDVILFNQEHAGEEVKYTVEGILRGKVQMQDLQGPLCVDCPTTREHTYTLTATLNPSDADYLLGVTMTTGNAVKTYSWSAPVVGAGTTLQLTGETFAGLGKMLWNLITGTARSVSLDAETRETGHEQISEASSGVTGIVGILGTIFPAFVGSVSDIAFLAALISVSLACMNVLPIPALDGGRWLLITIYKLKKKPLEKKKEEEIVAKAFIVLLALMVVVTILDIIRLF